MIADETSKDLIPLMILGVVSLGANDIGFCGLELRWQGLESIKARLALPSSLVWFGGLDRVRQNRGVC